MIPCTAGGVARREGGQLNTQGGPADISLARARLRARCLGLARETKQI